MILAAIICSLVSAGIRKPSTRSLRQQPVDPEIARVAYYGGPVISNVKVVTVFWGNFTDAQKKTIETYYQQVVNSSYMDYLSEYSTPTQQIGRGTWIGSYHETAKPASGEKVTAKYLKDKLQLLIQEHKVPPLDNNTYYALHLGGWGKEISYNGAFGCFSFMALHGLLVITQITLKPKIVLCFLG
jgi:hypothetical protein